MRKTVLLLSIMLLFAGLAGAQVPTSGNVFFGYSYLNADLSSNRTNTNGWEASLEGKIFPFVGVVADFDSHYGSQNFHICTAIPVVTCDAVFNSDVTEHNYLFGPRVSFSAGKFRPFVQALFGASHVDLNNGGGSDTSFATAIGGGLDYKIIRPVAWRFQGDYLATRFFSTTQNNVRLSTGIVVRF